MKFATTAAAALLTLSVGGAIAQERGPSSHPTLAADSEKGPISHPTSNTERGPVSHPTIAADSEKGPVSHPTVADTEKGPVSHPTVAGDKGRTPDTSIPDKIKDPARN
jgi:hypothetical protein